MDDLFGSPSQESSTSGYGALPPNIQGDINSISGVGRQLVENADQYFRPMDMTSEELMAQRMINPENLKETIGMYLNPFRDILNEDINKSMESPYAAFNQRATEAGAFGGSRMRGGQADLEQTRLDALSRAVAGQYNSAFDQSQTGISRLMDFGGFERGLDLSQRGALAQAFNLATGGSGLGFLPGSSQSSGTGASKGIFEQLFPDGLGG